MKKILVVGGAGYIGSHTCKALYQKGYEVVVYDNLSYGHKEFVKWGDFVLGDLCDKDVLDKVFCEHKIDALMHFAAFAYVGESVQKPHKYYQNNVCATINLLEAMRKHGVKKIIFSSTCATYGQPKYTPIDELHPQNPINPYGRTKLMVEQILDDYSKAYDFRFVALRYFNAAGCDEDAQIGEKHNPETHLIPLALDAAIGKRQDVKIFGTDYDTKDGTAIRDYIHVSDLANAHILAFEYLCSGGMSDVFNLGNEQGFSVKEVIECAKKITKIDFEVVNAPRRAGDPSVLVGSSEKIISKLGWKPRLNSLETIIQTAWNWHKKL